jgi:ubiquinone/menaquinone biosynthesis C-methylase UbiE
MSQPKVALVTEQPKNQINLNPIKRLFDRDPSIPQRHIIRYVTKSQVVADLGCGAGYYTLALAACVGPEGRVYAIDLNERAIRELEEKANRNGYRNIEVHTSSAADLSFIKDGTIDFVLANGLLCTMADHRQSAVNEIKRILKPGRQAYLSLGWPPPLGFVGVAEWERILEGFSALQRGGDFLHKWAVVSTKQPTS